MEELDDKVLEQIEAYCSGNMSGDELTQFEEKINVDTELAEQVKLFQAVKGGIKSYYFSQNIARNKKQYEKASGNSSVYWVAAASIVILIGFSFLYNFNSEPKDLFTENYTPYPYLGASRGDFDQEGLEKEAFEAYQLNQYQAASEKFEKLISDQPGNAKYLFYLGNSFLSEKEFNKAVEAFELIDEKSVYIQNTYWYLALSYIGLNENQKAIDQLKRIDPDSKLAGQAKDLLDDLK